MGTSKSIPMVSQPRDKIVIVTGSNSGVGYETAKFIAMMGAHVVLACRSEEKARDAMRRMNDEFQTEKQLRIDNVITDDELDIEFMKLDLASLKSTKAFIDNFKAKHKKLNLLICNAGIYSPHQVTTEDNLDLTYQVNYLSHFLIVAHLLPIMKVSGNDCRIILVSGEAHKKAKGFDPDYAAGKIPHHYDGYRMFAKTKLYQIMQMYSIDKVIEKTSIEICCVHPGSLVNTKFWEEEDSCAFCCLKCCYTCLCQVKAPHDGAATSIYAAITPDLEGISRAYYTQSKSAPRWPSSDSRSEDMQTYLFESTKELLKSYLTSDILRELELTPKITKTEH
ncbi:WW domain-containing oxidoreductase-like [Mytilus californianus]|uniref:WW domain-containing oxidoreductase-like n=1 Tax=Mytilus californianus TaxID=6549 RepID=UPI002246E0DF|nr:WW domain-containing oxidoreductase-like [Mytilus californianus]